MLIDIVAFIVAHASPLDSSTRSGSYLLVHRPGRDIVPASVFLRDNEMKKNASLFYVGT